PHRKRGEVVQFDAAVGLSTVEKEGDRHVGEMPRNNHEQNRLPPSRRPAAKIRHYLLRFSKSWLRPQSTRRASLFQTTTSPSRNRPGWVRWWWVPPGVVCRIPVRYRGIRPQSHSCHAAPCRHYRIEPISTSPDIYREREIFRGSVGVAHPETNRKWNRSEPMQRYFREVLPLRRL